MNQSVCQFYRTKIGYIIPWFHQLTTKDQTQLSILKEEIAIWMDSCASMKQQQGRDISATKVYIKSIVDQGLRIFRFNISTGVPFNVSPITHNLEWN